LEAEAVLLLFSTPLMVALILGEMIYSHFHHRKLYTTGDTVINLICTSWNFVNDLIFRATALLILNWVSEHAVLTFTEYDWVYWLLLFWVKI